MVPLVSAGNDRPFRLYVPKGYDGSRRLPLVVDLHGVWSTAEQQEVVISRLPHLADARGFAIAAPNGALRRDDGTYNWNVPGIPITPTVPVPPGTPDDERYVLDVIRRSARTVCIDLRRVYLTGYSGGAWLASQIACDYADRITAIAPVAGLRSGWPQRMADGTWRADPTTCRPTRPVPILTFHGTRDPYTPYHGSDDPRWGYGADVAMRRWSRLDGCRQRPRSAHVSRHVQLISYGHCRGGAVVELFLQRGAGHTWPGSRWPPIGPINKEIDANRLMWSFFSRFRR
jgi:polyhydroxybutyrate depolymerase